MISRLNEEEIKYLISHYLENKDIVSKTIGEDLRIISWIAWGIGILFPEKSPKEMFEYMKNPDLKLLAQLIVKEKNKFTQLSGKGYELDTVFSLLNNLSETLAFLNIENELSYSPKETPIRSLIYLYTMAYNLGTFYKSKKYSSLPGSYSVWVFPNVKHYHNRLEDHKFNETVIIDDMESAFVDTTEHKGTVDKLNTYRAIAKS